MNIPLILTLSVIPDVDLLLEPILKHGGPTHSIILYLVLALPALLIWKQQTIPYLAGLVSHTLLGDYLTRPISGQGVQLLFPLTSDSYALGLIAGETALVYSELILFAALSLLMLTTGDAAKLLKHHRTNLLLVIPLSTALLPSLIGFPLPIPAELIAPHLILIALLALSILSDVKYAAQRLLNKLH